MGNLLQFKNELCCVLGGCVVSAGAWHAERGHIKARDITFEVFGSQQDAANVMLLDKGTNVGSHRRAIEAHHEQLALHGPKSVSAAATVAWKQPTIVLHGEQWLARVLGCVAHVESESVPRCSPVEIIPYRIHLLNLGHDGNIRRVASDCGCDVGFRGAPALGRGWQMEFRSVGGQKDGEDGTVAFTST